MVERAATVRVEHDASLARLILDAPPLNLISIDLLEELSQRVDQLADSSARALLVKATGDVFSAGVDVSGFLDHSQAEAEALLRPISQLASKIEALPFPTLASVHGLCLTAGLELALACDLIWAAESAQLGQVEAVIGIVPLAGGLQRIAARAGIARANEMVLGARTYDAATMERWNIVNRVLPDKELEAQVERYAERLAQGPTLAHAVSKKLRTVYLSQGVAAADQAIPSLASPLFESSDLRDGIESLLTDGPGKAKFNAI